MRTKTSPNLSQYDTYLARTSPLDSSAHEPMLGRQRMSHQLASSLNNTERLVYRKSLWRHDRSSLHRLAARPDALTGAGQLVYARLAVHQRKISHPAQRRAGTITGPEECSLDLIEPTTAPADICARWRTHDAARSLELRSRGHKGDTIGRLRMGDSKKKIVTGYIPGQVMPFRRLVLASVVY